MIYSLRTLCECIDLLSDEDGLEKYEIAIIVVVVIIVIFIAVGVIIYMKLCRPHQHNPATVIVPGAQITGKTYSVLCHYRVSFLLTYMYTCLDG